MMDKNYVKKFKKIAEHEGINIGEPYTFIDDIEAEIGNQLENALVEEKVHDVLRDEKKQFQVPFSVKRTFPNTDDYVVIHGEIVKEWKKCGNKAFPYFSNHYHKIEFAKKGKRTEHRFFYHD